MTQELITELREWRIASAPYEPEYKVPPSDLHIEAADALERLQKEVNRQKSCILAMSEEIQTLVREAVDAQEKIRTYQQGAYK